MALMPNNSNIPASRVPLVELKQGLISTQWFRFFGNLFNLVGAGGNTTSIADTLVGAALAGLAEQFTELTKTVQGLQVSPPTVPFAGGTTTTATASLDFPNTAAQLSSDLTVTVPGAVLGDVVTLGIPNGSVLANSCYTAWVSVADTVTVRFNNYSAGAQNPASGLFRAVVTRF